MDNLANIANAENLAHLAKKADDLTKQLDVVTAHFQRLVDRATPTAKKIAGTIRVLGVLGLIGGVAGAAAMAMPGVGFAENWAFFVFLLIFPVVGASIVYRWGVHLREWSGDVRTTVNRLTSIPLPSEMVAKFGGAANELVKTGKKDPRSSILGLLGNARQFRKHLKDIPQFAGVAKDISVQLTGPFRPPLIVPRLVAFVCGFVVTIFGPLLLLIALIF